MNHSTPGLPVHHQLPKSTQTHAHWVGDAIQPSHPPSSPSPPALNLVTCIWYFLIFSIYLLKTSLCLFILILSLMSISMTVTFNFSSGNLFISISLQCISKVLFCSFIWNIFLCFFILLDALCWFLGIRWNNYLSFEKVALWLRWIIFFNLPLALDCFLNLCIV